MSTYPAHPAQLSARTRSVDETRALAASLVGIAGPGDLILLAGELGAGKTAFVQGFGRALGVTEPITSPTFALAQRYEARDSKLVVHHLDVYRLDRLHEVLDLGVAELLDEGGVVLIEWGNAVIPALPSGHLEVHISFGEASDDRALTLRTVGESWCARQRVLAEAASGWTVPSPPSSPERVPEASEDVPPC